MEFSGIATGPGVGADDDISLEFIETTTTRDALKLWPWVNQVSLGFRLRKRREISLALFTDTLDCLASASIRNRHATIQTYGVSIQTLALSSY